MANRDPTDAGETDEQRQERHEKHTALRMARREGGHVRSILLRDEDYASYDTRVWDMTGDAFLIFWLTYLYGGEFFEPFDRLPGYNHLWRAVILRRRGSPTSEDVIREEPVILVDLDECDTLVRIPADVWRYAFEKHRGEREFNLDVVTRVIDGREDTVQVILASARAGVIVKGPACLLLVLAQAKVPLQDFLPFVAAELSPEWSKVWSLQHDCDALLKQPGAGSLDALGITLEFPKRRVQELLTVLGTFEHIYIPNYVHEAWVLVAGDEVENPGQPRIENPEALVEGSSFQEGDTFTWVPLALREGELQASWRETPRIVRCERLGEKYYLNNARAAWAARPTIIWDEIEGMQMLIPRRTKIHPARLGRVGTPFVMRPILPDETSLATAEVTPFAEFWVDLFGRALRLIEHRDGWYLYRDQQPVESEGKLIIQETDLIVKDLSLPPVPTGAPSYYGGLQAFLDLFSPNGYPVRWFILYSWDEVVERDAKTLSEVLGAWGGGAIVDAAKVAKCLIRLRDESKLDVDILLGDLLGNTAIATQLLSADGATSIIKAWEYRADQGHYVAIAPDSAALEGAKTLLRQVIAGENEPESIVLSHLALEKLKREHPDEYEALAAEVEKLLPEWEEAGGSEEDTDEEEDLEEENEKGDWLDGAEVVEETDYFITYRDREGYEFGFEKEDSTFDEDFGHEYDLTPEDLADAPTMPEHSLDDVDSEEEDNKGSDEGDEV